MQFISNYRLCDLISGSHPKYNVWNSMRSNNMASHLFFGKQPEDIPKHLDLC